MRTRTVPILLVLLVAFTACSGSARERTVHASLVATNAARDGFLAFDTTHQAAIIKAATSETEGIAELGAYRARRSNVVRLFEAAYRAIAIAAVVSDDPTNLVNLARAASMLMDELRAVTDGKLGGTQ